MKYKQIILFWSFPSFVIVVATAVTLNCILGFGPGDSKYLAPGLDSVCGTEPGITFLASCF